MNQLVRMALRKADEVRRQFKLDIYQPLNVFDLCIELGLTVRFLDINMEGMYIKQENLESSQVLISNQRPMGRRAFTCAHELGHHLFGHGSKVDLLIDQSYSAQYDENEFLVDTFAGALLMPVIGVQAEFAKRDWVIGTASPIQFYTICSIFGSGYQSLVTHCKVNKIISDSASLALLKHSPAKILKEILGSDTETTHFKLIDNQFSSPIIDLEVGNLVFLPSDFCIEGSHLSKYRDTPHGTAYHAKKPGVVRVKSGCGTKNYLIRIQNADYVGLAEYRHLENSID